MGRVQRPINSNTREVWWGTWPENAITIARCCVHGYSITAAPAKIVTHVLFWWCIYVATFQAQSKGGRYVTQPVAWAMGSIWFSGRGYEGLSEPSELSGTARRFSRKLGLLLMSYAHWRIFGSLILGWNRNMLMNACDSVSYRWFALLGNIQKKLGLLKFHSSHIKCMKFLMTYKWEI